MIALIALKAAAYLTLNALVAAPVLPLMNLAKWREKLWLTGCVNGDLPKTGKLNPIVVA